MNEHKPSERLRTALRADDALRDYENAWNALRRWIESVLPAIERLEEENARLYVQHVSCDRCGGTWLDDGINSGCPCRALARLEAKVEVLEEIEHLRHTCVVCDCALVKDECTPPHCDISCQPGDDHVFDWNSAMCDHYRMLDELNSTPDAARTAVQEGGE